MIGEESGEYEVGEGDKGAREENERRVPNPIGPIPTHEVTSHVTYA